MTETMKSVEGGEKLQTREQMLVDLSAPSAQPRPLERGELAEVGPETFTVDELAQEIRRVDGNHDLGAGALAEALTPFLLTKLVACRKLERTSVLAALATQERGEPFGYWVQHTAAEPVFLRPPAHIPSGPNYHVTPLYTHPVQESRGEVVLDAAAVYLRETYGNSYGLDHPADRARIFAALQDTPQASEAGR